MKKILGLLVALLVFSVPSAEAQRGRVCANCLETADVHMVEYSPRGPRDCTGYCHWGQFSAGSCNAHAYGCSGILVEEDMDAALQNNDVSAVRALFAATSQVALNAQTESVEVSTCDGVLVRAFPLKAALWVLVTDEVDR